MSTITRIKNALGLGRLESDVEQLATEEEQRARVVAAASGVVETAQARVDAALEAADAEKLVRARADLEIAQLQHSRASAALSEVSGRRHALEAEIEAVRAREADAAMRKDLRQRAALDALPLAEDVAKPLRELLAAVAARAEAIRSANEAAAALRSLGEAVTDISAIHLARPFVEVAVERDPSLMLRMQHQLLLGETLKPWTEGGVNEGSEAPTDRHLVAAVLPFGTSAPPTPPARVAHYRELIEQHWLCRTRAEATAAQEALDLMNPSPPEALEPPPPDWKPGRRFLVTNNGLDRRPA